MSRQFRFDLDRPEERGFAGRGALSVVGVAIQGLVRFVYSVLIGRLLTPALLAATNSAISLALFTSLLWPTGTAAAATKFVARARGAGDETAVHAIARHLSIVSLAAAVPLALGAAAFSWWSLAPGDALQAGLVGALVIAWAMYSFVRGLHFAVHQVGRATLWDAIAATTAVVLLLAVILAGATALLLLPLTVGYALYAIAGIPRRHPGARSPLPADLRREMLGFTGWSTLGTLASTGLLQLSMVIAGSVGTPDAAGAYAAALTLATPASMVARSLSLVLFPTMAQATGRADAASVRRQTDLVSRGLVAVMGAIFGAIAVAAEPIVLLFFGARYADARGPLVILLAATFLVTINVATVNALSAGTRRGVRIPALLSAVGMVLGLAATWLLVPGLGVLGVALGYLVGAVVIGLGPISWVWATERMHWGGTALRAALGVTWAAALIIALGVLDPGWWWALAAAAAFLVVWVLLMLPEVRMVDSLRRPRGSAGAESP
ncbi:lipopolysaccharide biosynthesis protein [Agromyces binzhouensis]|uniref:lipopolysaccharide biosynthesis protein n=1 Tax=Agromyces binzhouensis TaxID=1817495 RepID=UPI0036335F67